MIRSERLQRSVARGLVSAAIVLVAIGCGQKYRQPTIDDVEPVQPNLGTLPDTQQDDVAAARERTERLQAQIAGEMDSITTVALSECTAYTCARLGGREVALGMTHAQVLVATGSTPVAWRLRGSTATGIMLPAHAPVHDAVGQLVMVVWRDRMVASYTYREPTGLRSVTNAVDATTAGRHRAMAQSLLKDGDDLVAAGRLYEALDKYVAAEILDPHNPDISGRIGRMMNLLEPPDEPERR